MSLKHRLGKIEDKIQIKKEGPFMLTLFVDEDRDKKIKELKDIYGEDYQPRIIIIRPINKSERN
ncbi:MAG: hypothetical protein KJ706_03965 [Candidatus Omnitrophica bacterium]|nr:hypothetical protein [Candidatus Omnitrophota bacterium]